MRYSFSLFDTFAKCPAQARRLYVTRDVKKESGPEAVAGVEIHQMLEAALLDGTPLPDPYKVWESYVEPLRRGYDTLYAEKRLMLTHDFQATEDSTEGVLVGEVDALIIKGDRALELDWKTGKPRDNKLQHQIYALLVLTHYPQVQSVLTCNVYLRHGQMGEAFQFGREQIAELRSVVAAKMFLWESALMYNRWPEKPSGLCGYCPVTDCKHWRKHD